MKLNGYQIVSELATETYVAAAKKAKDVFRSDPQIKNIGIGKKYLQWQKFHQAAMRARKNKIYHQ